jgi:hypothetical protein
MVQVAVWLLAAGAACTAATGACTEWVRPPGHKSRVLVHRSYPLDVRNDRVRRAFVFVHGIKRDAEDHFRTALAAAFLSGTLEDTVIVAPRFASSAGGPGNESGDCHDALAPDEANWICDANRPDTWRSGGVAVGPDRLSSFDVIDEIVRRLARKETFPNLKSIVIAGHSAGGQLVIRYEMTNGVHETPGVAISYIVSNPSSYAYVDALRPISGTLPPMGTPVAPAAASKWTPAFTTYPDGRSCPGFDVWPYGLRNRPEALARIPPEEVVSRLVSRPVTYLLGEADVLPLGVFDTSCPAAAQGTSRLGRGLAFQAYVNQKLHGHHALVVVPFCSHSARCIFTSETALPLMFPR